MVQRCVYGQMWGLQQGKKDGTGSVRCATRSPRLIREERAYRLFLRPLIIFFSGQIKTKRGQGRSCGTCARTGDGNKEGWSGFSLQPSPKGICALLRGYSVRCADCGAEYRSLWKRLMNCPATFLQR
jgi:hypothetical protein